jgi:hypothetical protein
MLAVGTVPRRLDFKSAAAVSRRTDASLKARLTSSTARAANVRTLPGNHGPGVFVLCDPVFLMSV